MHTDTNLA